MPRLYVQWPTVGEKSDDRYALDVLGAILAGPRTARLTKALVYDQQSAATSRRESELERGRRRVPDRDHPAARAHPHRPRGSRRRDVERLKAEGPTAEEIQKATAGEELLRARPRVEPGQGDDAGRRRRIPRRSGATSRPSIRRSLAVTAADVKRVANKYLTQRARRAQHRAEGKLDQAAKPAESKKVTQRAASGGARR